MYSASAAICMKNIIYVDNQGNTKCPSLPRYRFAVLVLSEQNYMDTFFFFFLNMLQDTLFTAIE